MDELARYLEKRDAVLMSGDIEKVRALLIEQGNEQARTASDEVLMIALHKGRVHWRDCPPDKLKESVWWLLDRKYDLMM